MALRYVTGKEKGRSKSVRRGGDPLEVAGEIFRRTTEKSTALSRRSDLPGEKLEKDTVAAIDSNLEEILFFLGGI